MYLKFIKYKPICPSRFYTTEEISILSYKGLPSAPGFFQGPACKIDDPSQIDKIKRGQVVVCKFITPTPEWTDVVLQSDALVIEKSGNISHGPMVARRNGIPCVSQFEYYNDFTETDFWLQVEDGDELTVLGTVGRVYVKKKKKEE